MNYGELKAKIIDKTHRKDMTARVGGFIDDARVRINNRLGLDLQPLVLDTDTNEILTDNYLLYFYPGVQAVYEFIEEYESASYFQNRFDVQLEAYYTTRAGTEPLTVTPEVPAP